VPFGENALAGLDWYNQKYFLRSRRVRFRKLKSLQSNKNLKLSAALSSLVRQYQ
jgi:hypothetical protein